MWHTCCPDVDQRVLIGLKRGQSTTIRSDIIAKAVTLSETIGETNHPQAFAHAVRDFVGLLAVVPDDPATEFSGDDIATLRTLAEGVLARIEQRLNTTDDSARVQLELVGAVYEVRKRLEQIDQWRRHFLGTPELTVTFRVLFAFVVLSHRGRRTPPDAAPSEIP